MKKNSYINNNFSKVYSYIQKRFWLNNIKHIMYYIDKILILFAKKPKYIGGKKKVVIIFNLSLGDGVILCCALKDIRNVYPCDKYTISLICQKGLDTIYDKLNVFDNIISINFTKATVNIKERYKNIKILTNEYYDILLDPIGANECTTNVLTSKVVYAKKKVGCLVNDNVVSCPKNILNNTYNEIKQISDKTLIEHYFYYFYDKNNISYYKFKSEKLNVKLPEKYYIVFPSASTPLKRWPIKRYAEIIKRVYKKTKLPLLLCGTEIDRNYYDELLELIPDIPSINIIGKTSLLEFIEVIKKSKFVITNDTSTYHIAVIHEIPVVIITGGYTYNEYVSYNFKNNQYKKPYIVASKNKCFNCKNKCIRINDNDKVWPCLDDITVDYAWNIIDKMIDKEM